MELHFASPVGRAINLRARRQSARFARNQASRRSCVLGGLEAVLGELQVFFQNRNRLAGVGFNIGVLPVLRFACENGDGLPVGGHFVSCELAVKTVAFQVGQPSNGGVFRGVDPPGNRTSDLGGKRAEACVVVGDRQAGERGTATM